MWQNPNIEAKTKELVNKVAAFKTTNIPPAEDTSKFKLVPSSLIKTLSVGGAPTPVAVEPASPAERKNYVPADKAAGFSYKKAYQKEFFSVSGERGNKLVMSDGNCQLPLKHKPDGNYFTVLIYPGSNYKKSYIENEFLEGLGLDEVSSDSNGQFYYENARGRHGAFVILYPKDKNKTSPECRFIQQK